MQEFRKRAREERTGMTAVAKFLRESNIHEPRLLEGHGGIHHEPLGAFRSYAMC